MTRSLKIRKPNAAERRHLQAVLEETMDKQVRRRTEAVLFYADGLNAVEIAAALKVHASTVRADLQAFDRQGLAYLQPLAHGGARPRLTQAQREEIWRLAEQTTRRRIGQHLSRRNRRRDRFIHIPYLHDTHRG